MQAEAAGAKKRLHGGDVSDASTPITTDDSPPLAFPDVAHTDASNRRCLPAGYVNSSSTPNPTDDSTLLNLQDDVACTDESNHRCLPAGYGNKASTATLNLTDDSTLLTPQDDMGCTDESNYCCFDIKTTIHQPAHMSKTDVIRRRPNPDENLILLNHNGSPKDTAVARRDGPDPQGSNEMITVPDGTRATKSNQDILHMLNDAESITADPGDMMHLTDPVGTEITTQPRSTVIAPSLITTPTELSSYALHCVQIYNVVRSTGVHNYMGARIPVPSNMDIRNWRSLLCDYHDQALCDFLEFGWPVNYIRDNPPQASGSNHGSAIAYADHVATYIHTEIELGAILGPFEEPPFSPWFNTSPLMTRPKRASNVRRIIQDHSWPIGASVNAGVPRDVYLGRPYKLRLPSVDDLVSLIIKHGPGCFLYGTDLSRAYKQLRSCPLDWPLLGIHFDSKWYLDISISFGLRWGAMACQRVTEAICYITGKQGHDNISYIDDFAGAAHGKEMADKGLSQLQDTLNALGVIEARDKASYPSTTMVWIGILFDTIKMQLSIPADKLSDIRRLLHEWRCKRRASRHQIQQLLGKLFYIAQCCKPARLFVSRMLETLRQAPPCGHTELGAEFQKDVLWFIDFLPAYNGVYMINKSMPDITVHVDSCLTGAGGLCDKSFYATPFPTFVLLESHPIHQLEMLNIVVAVKLFGENWHNKIVRIICDNAPAIAVLQSGRGRDPFLLACARDIWFQAARYGFELLPQHAPGTTMDTVDQLSRAHMDQRAHRVIDSLLQQGFSEVAVEEHVFKITTREPS